MSICSECFEDPCICGHAGYVIIHHHDIQERICSLARMLAMEDEAINDLKFQLGEMLLEALMSQDEGDWT